jgi:hypothetical protein
LAKRHNLLMFPVATPNCLIVSAVSMNIEF